MQTEMSEFFTNELILKKGNTGNIIGFCILVFELHSSQVIPVLGVELPPCWLGKSMLEMLQFVLLDTQFPRFPAMLLST